MEKSFLLFFMFLYVLVTVFIIGLASLYIGITLLAIFKVLLIPFNDRNFHANEEIAKISLLDERMGHMEAVVGEHSEVIRRLETA